ncbi:MAG: hypothetical protein QXR39_08985 [Candidatus Methanomethylicia archaeon]
MKKIYEQIGATQFGQICQDLITLSFCELGCKPRNIEINNVEGVDIIINDPDFGKYAVEVKTTLGNFIQVGRKDYNGLTKYSENNYHSLLAVLKLDLYGEWIFYDAKKLKGPGTISVKIIYTPDNLKELSKKINEKFEDIVNEHNKKIFENKQRYTQELLRQKGIKYTGNND